MDDKNLKEPIKRHSSCDYVRLTETETERKERIKSKKKNPLANILWKHERKYVYVGTRK